METSDLHFDADATKATSDMNLPTDSKSVKRRSSERSLSHRATHHRSSHRLRIHTSTAIPVSMIPLEDGGRHTMSKQTRYPRCLTLRLNPMMDDGLEDLAYDLRLSKAGTIRRILGREIALAYEHGTQNTQLHGAQ